MTKIYLNVPYPEKDKAKAVGAKWDGERKRWFALKNANFTLLEKWLPRESLLVGPIWIAKSSNSCWKCSEETFVFSLVCSEVIEVTEDDGEVYIDILRNKRIYIFNLTDIDSQIEMAFKKYAPRYECDYSKMQQAMVRMNHCEHCGAKQGDFYMHNEPGGAFFPMNEREEEKISLIEILSDGQYRFSGTYGMIG